MKASSSPFPARRHRIDMKAATGKTVMIYGQTEVTLDLMNARKAAGLTSVYEAKDVQPHDFDGSRPRVTYVKDGVTHTIDCDFIAGCDGFPASAAPASRPQRSRSSSGSIRSAGSASCPETPPRQPRADLFQPRARLRALHHALDHTVAATTCSARSTTMSTSGRTTASGTN